MPCSIKLSLLFRHLFVHLQTIKPGAFESRDVEMFEMEPREKERDYAMGGMANWGEG